MVAQINELLLIEAVDAARSGPIDRVRHVQHLIPTLFHRLVERQLHDARKVLPTDVVDLLLVFLYPLDVLLQRRHIPTRLRRVVLQHLRDPHTVRDVGDRAIFI